MKNEIIVKKAIGYAEKIINYCAGKDYDALIVRHLNTRPLGKPGGFSCLFAVNKVYYSYRH